MADQPGAAEPHDQPDVDAARANALNGPMRRVQAGEWTLRQADAAWEAADVLPYPKALPGGLPALSWPLPVALAWIATRRRDLTEREALRAQFWGERVAQEPAAAGWATDIATAQGLLEAALLWGEVTALGRRAGEEVASEVPAAEWVGLTAGFAEGSVALDRGLGALAPARWLEIQLRPAHVVRLWPAASDEAIAPATPGQPAHGTVPVGVAALVQPSPLPVDRPPVPTGSPQSRKNEGVSEDELRRFFAFLAEPDLKDGQLEDRARSHFHGFQLTTRALKRTWQSYRYKRGRGDTDKRLNSKGGDDP